MQAHPLVHRLPTVPEVRAPGEPATPGLVKQFRDFGMRRQGMTVRLGAWPLVLPGLATVGAPQHTAQLYTDHDETGVYIGRGYRPDVGGPRTGREAPGRLGGQLPHLLQFPPGAAPVAADEQGRRLRAHVDGPIYRRDGYSGDPGVLDAGHPVPATAAVHALEQALVRGAHVERVGISGIHGQ